MSTSRATKTAHRKTTFQLRLSRETRDEISASADALGLNDSAYLLAAHKLFCAELVKRGVLVAAGGGDQDSERQ